MTIAISQGTGDPKYEKYAPWLATAGRGVETIELSEHSDAETTTLLHTMDGIVFTGGADVHPARYGQPDALGLCGTIDLPRDTREFRWFATARERGIPILAICRGMQLVNVALGGTLIPHLPSVATHRKDGYDAKHALQIASPSLLATLARATEVTVNSSHHQAVDQIADELRVTARAPDGIVEAMEWRETKGKPFFLGVQWHPERMPPDDFLSSAIAKTFLQAVAASL